MLQSLPPELLAIGGVAAAILAAYLGGRNATARRKAIKLETMIRDYLRDQFNFPTPRTKQLTPAEVRRAIENAAPEGAKIDIRVWDGTYIAPLAKDVSRLRVFGTLLGVFPYRPARFDCEDFGKFFAALCPLVFGTNSVALVIDRDAGHAYNLIVTADGDVVFYEPNGDKVVEPQDGTNYVFKNALVLV